VAAVCPAGACAGRLNGFDVTGYTWASVDEVFGLFNSYGISPPLVNTSGSNSASEVDSSWAPAFLSDFTLTGSFPGRVINEAWTKESFPAPDSRGIIFEISDGTPGSGDDVELDRSSPNTAGVSLGAWFWAPAPSATPVPTMSTYGLVLTGFYDSLGAGEYSTSNAPLQKIVTATYTHT
jgi:hypothetical protein